ncbi:MAG TPA: tetratricopeptide repeat protein, partial [Chthoniobacterales bacterium]
MTRSLGRFALALLIALSLPQARAQDQVPVRRAIPVQEPPVARALPVEPESPTPSATPMVRRALPVPEETIAPVTPAPTSPAQPNETPPNETEPNETPPASAVESTEQRQLNYANALFGRKLYDLAVPEYEKFLGLYPSSPARAAAYFYLGESYRALGRTTAAQTSFQSVVTDFPESDLAGPAAYGLAEILFKNKDYAGARPLFHSAAAKVKASALALSARYFEARCLENLDRKDEARDIYEEVVDVPDPNPYRDDSLLAIGSIFLEKGRKADALAQFQALAKETTKAPLKAEATVRAGSLALDLAQANHDPAMLAKATALLKKGRALPEAGRWSGIAAVGLLRLDYQNGQYAQAVADYAQSKSEVPNEAQPEMMLLAANSQRQLSHYKDAQDLYRQIIQKYPGRAEAKDAAYQNLIALYNANDPSLGAAVDQFLKDNPSGEHSDQAKLIKAEALYKAHDFAAAAPLYQDLRDSKLSDKLRAEAAFKLGWCFVETKETARAIDAFTYFLQQYHESDEAASALAQRALAYQQTKQYPAALQDLDRLLAQFPKAPEREAALQQKALLLGQTDDNKGMADAFRQLLREFPKTAAAAQAHYYIGKSAFEAKDYATAIAELKTARQLAPQQYGTPASLRIMSAYFYEKDRAALAHEIDQFAQTSPNEQVPAEILEWLGLEFYNAKDYAAAAKYLTALSKTGNVSSVKPDFWFYLGDAQMKLNQPEEAEKSLEKFLASANDPAAKTKALLALG